MTISKNSEHFRYFNFETAFLKNKNLFKKLDYCLLVESTKIENPSFPYITTLLEADVKTNRMVLQNVPIKKNRVLLVTTLFFENFVSV